MKLMKEHGTWYVSDDHRGRLHGSEGGHPGIFSAAGRGKQMDINACRLPDRAAEACFCAKALVFMHDAVAATVEKLYLYSRKIETTDADGYPPTTRARTRVPHKGAFNLGS
jgi:hypothetical protein